MKYPRQITMTILAGLLGLLSANAAGDIKVEHAGSNNTLVRVTGEARYLLLPVEESVDDATVIALKNGKPEQMIYVRLARNKVDYYVPFDLSRYDDGTLLLNIVTAQSRSSVRDAKEDVCWRSMVLSDTFDTTNTERYRPLFHHTPLYGWMNDPNGMFWKNGRWHLYYQYNPYGSKWQNMTWGHSSSVDLINWEHHPLAIEPDGLGTIFSGSCVVDKANTAGFGADEVIALCTSAGINQMQSMAHSDDNGETFDKFPGNPVITLDSEARDPNMFWNETTGEWNLLLAHALEHEMLVFTSPDLKNWTLQSAFGKGLGAQDGVWECPDLMRLPVRGSDEKKWVLICNLNPGGPFGGSATQYFTGEFDGRAFRADTVADGSVSTKWMDFGKDHYATVSWSNAPDDRHVVIGWMSNWQYAAEVPTRQFRSANTLPRDVVLFKADDGQYYISTEPSPEVLALRGDRCVKAGSKSFGSKGLSFALPRANDGICEICLNIKSSKGDPVTVSLSNSAGEHADIIYDPLAKTVSFDRTNAGLSEFSSDFATKVWAPTFSTGDSVSLRIFVDRSSIEVFDADGRFVMTDLVFPTEPYSTLKFSTTGGKAVLSSLSVYGLNPAK